MRLLDLRARGVEWLADKDTRGQVCGAGGRGAVTEAIDDDQRMRAAVIRQAPGVPAGRLAFASHAYSAESRCRPFAHARHHDGSLAGGRLEVKFCRETLHGT